MSNTEPTDEEMFALLDAAAKEESDDAPLSEEHMQKVIARMKAAADAAGGDLELPEDQLREIINRTAKLERS
jgi:chorismate mutase